MDKINHPEEGEIDRYVLVTDPSGTSFLCENSEEGVAQEFAIPADQLADVRDLLTDTVKITYKIWDDDFATWRPAGPIHLPSWCAGSPTDAVSLYLFGYPDSSAVHGAAVVNEPLTIPNQEV